MQARSKRPEGTAAPGAGLWPPGGRGVPPADLRASEQFCRQMARREAANFYWGFVSLAREQRVAIYALYDFSRQVDDEADLVGPAQLPERLDAHRERVRRCMRGEYADPVMHVLAHAVRRFAIPESELLAIVAGVEMDYTRKRYDTWEDLQEYCRLVASVVGRLCVRIFGCSDARAFARADELGLAMQLTNCLRDVREDAQMGRFYLPQEDLGRFGVSEQSILDGRPGPGWRPLVAFEAQRARELFASGLGVVRWIPRRPAVCVRTMAGIYQRILARIERDPDRPLARRVSLSNTEKLHVMLESWLSVA
jgi:15-cis-phytoene synthase